MPAVELSRQITIKAGGILGKCLFDEDAVIKQYYELRSCRKVAELYGCSGEHIRRVLKKHNVDLTGWKTTKPTKKRLVLTEGTKDYIAFVYLSVNSVKECARIVGCSPTTVWKVLRRKGLGRGMGGNQDKQIKITDDQIRKDAPILNCREIAIKYNMSEEQVWRRAKKIGINVRVCGIGGKWRHRADRYGCKEFDESITLEKLIHRDGGICQICGKQTDSDDISNGHIGRMYPTLDHIVPLSKGGSHTWDNVQLAHMACNSGKCDKMSGGEL